MDRFGFRLKNQDYHIRIKFGYDNLEWFKTGFNRIGRQKL
jgi:hypothetical protein